MDILDATIAPPIIIRIANPTTALVADAAMPDAGLSEHDKADAKKAAASAKRAATIAARQAKDEEKYKAKCLHEQTQRMKAQAPTAAKLLLKSHQQRSFAKKAATMVHPGDYVEVQPDLSPGVCDHGGMGWVFDTREVEATDGGAPSTEGKVVYSVGGPATWVPACRITRTAPYTGAQGVRACRERAAAAVAAAAAAAALPPRPAGGLPLLEALPDAVRRRKAKGWRKLEMTGKGPKARLSTKEKMLCGAECAALERHLATLEAADKRHTARGKRSGLFQKSKKKWQQPLSKKYLAWAWGIGRSSMDDYAEARSETAL